MSQQPASTEFISIAQMASLLLSDTSESEDENVEKGYNWERKTSRKKSNAALGKNPRNWPNKLTAKQFPEGESKPSEINQISDEPVNETSPEIPKIIQFNVQQIEANQNATRLTEIDPRKLKRWQDYTFQYILEYNASPTHKSKLNDFSDLIDGKQALIDRYKFIRDNLNVMLNASTSRLEAAIIDQEEKESNVADYSKKIPQQPESVTDSTEIKTKCEDGDSEHAATSPTVEEFEASSSKNCQVPPNIYEIYQLLGSKITFPPKAPEMEQLGLSLQKLEERGEVNTQIMRIVYFFVYKSRQNADTVKTEYDDIVKIDLSEMNPKNNTGCLLIYKNVNMAIVMVEGRELELLKHFGRLKTSNVYGDLKRGKVLYVHQHLAKAYFKKWVVRIESPAAGKIRFPTKRKAVLYRTLASRMVRASRMLHKLYRHLSREEKYLIDPKSVYTKRKYISLLPPPSLFGYLFKYNIARDLKNYVENIGALYDMDSEDDELFAFFEFAEELGRRILDDAAQVEMKYENSRVDAAVVEENIQDIRKIKRTSDGSSTVNWKVFDLDEVDSTLIDSRIRDTSQFDFPASHLSAALETKEAVRMD